MASAAFENFQKVLEQEPNNPIAIAFIASLNLNQKKWDEAQQWYERLTVADPEECRRIPQSPGPLPGRREPGITEPLAPTSA